VQSQGVQEGGKAFHYEQDADCQHRESPETKSQTIGLCSGGAAALYKAILTAFSSGLWSQSYELL